MALKFRRRISLGKHIKVNVGKNGVSTSFKIGNTTINPKRNKVTYNTHIKGLSYETKLYDNKPKTTTSNVKYSTSSSAKFTTTASDYNEFISSCKRSVALFDEHNNLMNNDVNAYTQTINILEQQLNDTDMLIYLVDSTIDMLMNAQRNTKAMLGCLNSKINNTIIIIDMLNLSDEKINDWLHNEYKPLLTDILKDNDKLANINDNELLDCIKQYRSFTVNNKQLTLQSVIEHYKQCMKRMEINKRAINMMVSILKENVIS